MGDSESSNEDGEQIKQDVKNEIPLTYLEDNINEIQKKTYVHNNENIFVSYGEVAERLVYADWSIRKEMLKKCLLGGFFVRFTFVFI